MKFYITRKTLVGVILVLCAIIAAMAMTGCTGSRTQATTDTETRDTVQVTGTATIPGYGAVPLNLSIDRQQVQQARTESETQPDYSAMGAAIGTAVAESLKAAVSNSGIGTLLSALTGSAGVGTLGVAYLAMQKRKQLKIQQTDAPEPKA